MILTTHFDSLGGMEQAIATGVVAGERDLGAQLSVINKPNDANARVANTNAGMATSTSKFGDQPSASEPNTMTNAGIAMTRGGP